MTRLKTLFGQFGLIGGICRASSDCILVEEPSPVSPASRWKGNLYVLAEPVPEGSRGYQAAQQLLTEIARSYYACTSPSITTCLTRAFREANRSLFQHNMQVSGHEKITVGVTCAVVRGGELFIAEVLPGQAFIVHQGHVQAFPLSTSWDPEATTMPTVARLFAVGWSEDISIEFFHSALQSGDGFCLCTSNMGRSLGKDEVEQALLYQEPADVVEQLYRQVHQLGFGDAHAVVVELQPAISRQAASFFSRAGLQERAKLAGEAVAAWASFTAGEVGRVFRPRRTAGERRRAQKRRPQPLPAPPPETPPLARPKTPEPLWKAAATAARNLVRGKPHYPALERPKMRVRAPKERRRNVTPYIIAVVAVLVLGALTYLIVRGTQQREEARIAQLVTNSEQRRIEAGQAADIAEANNILGNAEQDLLAALDPRRPQPRVEYALSNLRADRDRINHVIRFLSLDLVVDPRTTFSNTVAPSFAGACGNCAFSDLIMIGESVYLLEAEKGTVYLYSPVASEVSPVIWPGLTVQGRAVSAIRAMAALERPKDCLPGESGEVWLAVVDADHWLYLHRGGQWEAYALSSETSWADKSLDLEGYQGNIYVFDAEPDQIIKYYCNAYELRPESWIKDPRQVRMIDAVDTAIDGSIYVLLKDGTTQVLLKGALDHSITYQEYKAGIYPPTVIAGEIFTDLESPYLYITDRYVGRIIQVRKEGRPAFVRDLRGPEDADLQDLQAIVVRERQGVIYLIAGGSLYRGVLPPPGVEPAAAPVSTTPTP